MPKQHEISTCSLVHYSACPLDVTASNHYHQSGSLEHCCGAYGTLDNQCLLPEPAALTSILGHKRPYEHLRPASAGSQLLLSICTASVAKWQQLPSELSLQGPGLSGLLQFQNWCRSTPVPVRVNSMRGGGTSMGQLSSATVACMYTFCCFVMLLTGGACQRSEGQPGPCALVGVLEQQAFASLEQLHAPWAHLSDESRPMHVRVNHKSPGLLSCMVW